MATSRNASRKTSSSTSRSISRRQIIALSVAGLPCLGGCVSPWFLGDVPSEKEIRRNEIKEALKSEHRPRLIKQVATKQELTMAALENVALVTGLVSGGGKVKPSPARERLLAMMVHESTDKPNTVIDDRSTAMVSISIAAPPAARKGTTHDVFVNLSEQATATDLANGRVFKTPLLEVSRLGGGLQTSFENARARGTIVTIAQATGSENPEDKLRGSIIGGAKLVKQRELGLAIRSDLADAFTVKKVLDAVESRFTVFDGSSHVGAGTPVRDSYISLDLPKRYELDPFHFANVVVSIGFNETPEELAQRQSQLARQVLDPVANRDACLELEAIGEAALPVLASALNSPDPSVRFFAAHSMAYLDDKRAIEALKQACIAEPAFRLMALNALSIMEHFAAETALRSLLHAAEPEVRYGAVRALRHRDKRDFQVTANDLGSNIGFLEIPTEGPSLVAVSLSKAPEIVIFGENPEVHISEFMYINTRMLVRPEPDGLYSVSHFVPDSTDRIARCKRDLRSVLEAIAKVGGQYGDCVKFVREASGQSAITVPVVMNPVPVAGRVYEPAATVDVASSEILDAINANDQLMLTDDDLGSEESSQSFSIFKPSSWLQN